MNIKWAVHHVFDCLDYNEHHYFLSKPFANQKFEEIVAMIRNSGQVFEVFTDTKHEFYVQLNDGLEKVYIEKINL